MLKTVKKGFGTKKILFLGLAIVIILIGGAYYFGKKPSAPISSSTNTTVNWKTYTRNVPADKTPYYNDPKFTITIQYPSDWAVKESHTLSNRVVDNPKEINTAVFSGKGGEIVMEWGPMGFGGGCDPSMNKSYNLVAYR